MSKAERKIREAAPGVFAVKDCALIAIATGNRAINLKELRDILNTISLDSIYYHFWGGLLQPRFEEREYNNDFAAWAWYGLHDATLAERLAVIDPTEYVNLEDLRQELLGIIEERLDEQGYLSLLYSSSRFEFISSQIVVFDSQKRVSAPADLATLLPAVSTSTVFYHFIDAKRRLAQRNDDFSSWLSGYGEQYRDLCLRLSSIDPYFVTLSQLKDQLTDIFQEYFAEVMG
jgi:hypothetical protein